MNYDLRCMAFAFLIACALWVLSSSGNTILGTVAILTVIIASATYHRVAGIIAVLVAIAFMQQTHAQKEGLTMPAPPLQFESAAEFREKFCMKGVAQSAGNEPMVLQYMLSPALFDDTNGKSQFKTDVIQQINMSSLNSCTANGSNHMSIANMCDPGCNWTTTAPSSTPSSAPSSAPITEGFNPMSALRPYIRTGQHMITDGVTNLTASANRLKRQLF